MVIILNGFAFGSSKNALWLLAGGGEKSERGQRVIISLLGEVEDAVADNAQHTILLKLSDLEEWPAGKVGRQADATP